MKYLRVIFKNYIGFFNGMGLYTVDIDFTRCKHNIINIQGGNGRGKSTILNHLNPFPDNSSSFIPNKTAEKDLVLCHENDVYNIQIISPADLKSRKTTKAFIQKNGVELNSNGNISSYKDIIFSEFELDSNYISLSRLSSTDRGLGDKTPAERKRFTSNIIDNLEIYNNIYKALNKKSLIYKSHINTLHTKIQNIGDKTSLEQQLLNLKNREADISNEIMNYNNLIISIQAKNSIDEEEAIKIKSINDEYNRLNSIVLGLENNINSYTRHESIISDLDKYFVGFLSIDNAFLNMRNCQ
jgi:energy-coupling factor transporter ATP-binding protein EcfA2